MRIKIILKVTILLFAVAFITTKPKPAQACCTCVATVTAAEPSVWTTLTIPALTTFMTNEFAAYRMWYIQIFWEDNVLPAMMLMAEQLSAVAMQQAQIVGSFFDAKHQMETQQLFQKIRARSHKDYHPSAKYGLCEIGTTVKSLAASDRRSEFTALVMSQRSQDRHLGNANTSASEGNTWDKDSRLKQFREHFCDIKDNNKGLEFICDHEQDQEPLSGGLGAQKKERMNKDIDFARTVDFPWTLDIDFSNNEKTDHEEEVLALANNLYGNDVFTRPSADLLRLQSGAEISDMQKLYLDARSVLAKRSVAENSYNAITGMKAAGAPGSREYMMGILSELGISSQDANILVGGDPAKPDGNDALEIEPSYYAQMEVLTKKIYQNPDFYTHLYDKPANVERREVAMQAIGLMQKFDLFKSYLRSEASLSVLLELAIMDQQDVIENDINQQGVGGQQQK